VTIFLHTEISLEYLIAALRFQSADDLWLLHLPQDIFVSHCRTYAIVAVASTAPPVRRWPSPTRRPFPATAILSARRLRLAPAARPSHVARSHPSWSLCFSICHRSAREGASLPVKVSAMDRRHGRYGMPSRRFRGGRASSRRRLDVRNGAVEYGLGVPPMTRPGLAGAAPLQER
jgi:hypothetical protein